MLLTKKKNKSIKQKKRPIILNRTKGSFKTKYKINTTKKKK